MKWQIDVVGNSDTTSFVVPKKTAKYAFGLSPLLVAQNTRVKI